MTDLCGRCGKELHGLAEEELCMFCEGALCVPCWRMFGCCDHPEAAEWERRMAQAKTRAERQALVDELGPAGSPRFKKRAH